MATGATGHHGPLAQLAVDQELSHASVFATLLLPSWEEKTVRAKAGKLRNVRSHSVQVSVRTNDLLVFISLRNLIAKCLLTLI